MDKKKYKDIFYTYYNPLVNYAAKLLGNHRDAKDVVQDVFIKLWEKRADIVDETVQSYLFTATKNHVFDVIKKNKHHENYVVFLEQNNNDISEIIDNFLLKEKISNSIRQLPPKSREIFILSKRNGLTYQEIADYLKISKKTVENQMSNAFKYLREILKDQ